jgi:hypothetical protein
MSLFTKIVYDEARNPDPDTLPNFGVRVIGTTVRVKPLPTNAIYDAYRDCGFTEAQRNDSMSAILAGHGEHPSRVAKKLAEYPVDFTRSAFVEMYRLRAADRHHSAQKFEGEWAWVSDAMPLTAEHDLIPTHYMIAPAFEP